MASISSYYNIQTPTPFVDVDSTDDTRLYLDPRRIRLLATPAQARAEAVHCLDTFWDRIASTVVRHDLRGKALLQRFHEPKETRLGMSLHGIDGKGGADQLGEDIWEVLSTDLYPLFRVAILKHIEDLPAFVPDVASDRTSDIVTRIVFEPLANFTALMCSHYPQMGSTAVEVERQVWNPATSDWQDKTVRLPIADGKPLLLVPKDWVRSTLMISATRFYEKTVLDYAQDSESVVLGDGTVRKPAKKDLPERAQYKRGYETIVRLTLEAYEGELDLLEEFRQYVDWYEDTYRL